MSSGHLDPQNMETSIKSTLLHPSVDPKEIQWRFDDTSRCHANQRVCYTIKSEHVTAQFLNVIHNKGILWLDSLKNKRERKRNERE